MPRRSTVDFYVFDFGTIVAFSPNTKAARRYFDTKLRVEQNRFRGEALVLGPKAAEKLEDRLRLAGFHVTDSDV
jgi:hypothetical protein